jgi:ABC-type Fe3+ transport system permease subunit
MRLHITSIGLLLVALLFIVRLVAIKMNRNPIMKRYKPDTPKFRVYQKLRSPQRFKITLTIAIIATILLAILVTLSTLRLIHENSSFYHYMLVFGPMSDIAIFALAIGVSYIVMTKKFDRFDYAR